MVQQKTKADSSSTLVVLGIAVNGNRANHKAPEHIGDTSTSIAETREQESLSLFPLDIEHRLLEVVVDAVPPQPDRAIIHPHPLRRLVAARGVRRHRLLVPALEDRAQIEPRALAREVRVVRGRDEAHRLRRARVQVRVGVDARLDLVRRELVLVVDDDVVRRAHGALQAVVRLQPEVSSSSL